MTGRRRSWKTTVAVALTTSLAGFAVLIREEGPSPSLNVVLVSIDTLRADHLGCYGYERVTSPWIDAFSREAILFEQVIAAAPSTLASHASMFTSLVVPHHGASVTRRSALAPRHVTLAEILRARGYATASWNGGAQVNRIWGLGQGFEIYHSFHDAIRDLEGAPTDFFEYAVESALEWIDGRSDDRPFLLFLHTYEVHHPYTPRPEMRELFERYPTRLTDEVSVDDLRRLNRGEWTAKAGDLAHIVASYDAEIRSVDEAFGRLIVGLRSRGLLDRTVLVVTSDHGEEFGEHGAVGWHSHTLFDELLRVPLLIRLPEARHGGRRIAAQVRGIDVAPTILSLLGVSPPPTFEGRSVMPGETESGREVVVGALSARDSGTDQIALREEGWKWIAGALYDLRGDPGETRNVRQEGRANRVRGRAMERRVNRWLRARPRVAGPTVDLDASVEAQLRALGYLE